MLESKLLCYNKFLETTELIGGYRLIEGNSFNDSLIYDFENSVVYQKNIMKKENIVRFNYHDCKILLIKFIGEKED
jgi:hypothetical protein